MMTTHLDGSTRVPIPHISSLFKYTTTARRDTADAITGPSIVQSLKNYK